MAGIYIHIPFCVSKCSYCDFYSCASTVRIKDFTDALIREMHARKSFLGEETVRTVYFGGGTPSLLPVSRIEAILSEISELFNVNAEEITLEANPDDLTTEYLRELAETPVNRLSIGIQSFDDAHLRLMNRRHTAEQAEKAVRDAQKAGFGNISADLIFGLPGMDDSTWEQNIDRMLGLGVQHISAYHLTIEDGTPFSRMAGRGEIRAADEETSERQYALLRKKLCGAGFGHYEISNFALPGRRAQHNSSYWQGRPYLGLGPSAHSYNGRHRSSCVPDIDRYITESPSPGIFETESLSPDDIYNEYVMVRLRCADGIDLGEFETRFGRAETEKFILKAEKFIHSGLLRNENDKLCVPSEHFLVSDRIISELFNA